MKSTNQLKDSDFSLLIQQVRVIDPIFFTERNADVLVVNGIIEAVEPHLTEIPQDIPIQNGQGLIFAPGLVDLYSHSGQPGYENRETLQSMASAAAAGGFTRMALLPNTVPPLDNLEMLTSMHQKIRLLKDESKPIPSLNFWGSMTLGNQGQQMVELAEIATKTIGLTDTYSLFNFSLLRQILEYLKPFNKVIAIAINSQEFEPNAVIREGIHSLRYGLLGNPVFSEAITIAALIEMIDEIGTPVHLMRISTERGVELIANAKQRGIPITASTTWMHLLFDSQDLVDYNPNLRLQPPLGNKQDVLALVEGVKQGIIDAIAIDHNSYTYEEKTLAFAKTPPGVIGLELALPLLWQKFVVSGIWSALELWQALSMRPLICLEQEPVSIKPGQKAEAILFDPQIKWTVNQDNLYSLGVNTPWWGQEISGRVIQFWN
ncbi:dihydroorotase, multifunctional complex type [Stanieria cyanosphaera PCC 7437]|uniref:Dihydroorotase, multifunctional complex type n=1 Tax=Stanieria cyanosphaera (strain ATCC 29371 / PCC 7437) TaxID=111780 RepID=K9XUQ0_STAC7|nr:dihydroorotase [Stanieria cyanosphaera]AFZ35806.1 dihydroorotase, multifunctional complex type [Stanieria cyanosphaera PCC 7437]